ncbi:MAG: preprotein translocase subunit SecY [Candidatus Eisenbacteria bacterium RBG_16_71_46]|nr:MAG: preprotein translocase subunit SecY [Candidatus Eisenbacteria bacterium RBG_16_71_46]OGF24580.1 MAG: preprotein translocase subunit SecY [Candidatus Eisenbacteria bacterium RBG_19FT_COMBO_70_11]
MIEKIRNIFQVPELKRRILFTLALFVIYRLGEHLPSPGVNAKALAGAFESQRGTLFGLYDLFVGGAFSRATIFALGIMPYISSSIILQVLGAVVPYFEKLRKEGEEGQKKLTQITRYGTVLISIIQSFAYAVYLVNMGAGEGLAVVPDPGPLFFLSTVVTQTTGTIFVMWLGEKITEHGIGNGISLIIFVNIIGGVPNAVLAGIDSFRGGSLSLFTILAVLIIMVGVVAAVVVMTQAQRKIPVQYAKRIVGRRMYGGASTHIPLRVNSAGVIPIIFASSFMILPATIAGFVPPTHPLAAIGQWLSPGSLLYMFIYGIIIIFFTYFYTAVVLNPNDLAENMRKYGGFVPGIRPGRKTAEYIDRVLSRITLPGAVFLALIAVVPDSLLNTMGLPFLGFGGTSVLIVVGVALDTLQQVESHLLMRHYEGFVKKGRIRGRQRM